MVAELPKKRPNLTPIDPDIRSAVRTASLAGVPDVRLSAKYGIREATIRQWRLRDPGWHAAVIAQGRRRPPGPPPVLQPVTVASAVAEMAVTVTDSLQELGETGSLRAAQIVHRSISAAPDDLPIRNVQDLSTAIKSLRTIAGLDRESAVTLNLGLFGGAPGMAVTAVTGDNYSYSGDSDADSPAIEAGEVADMDDPAYE